MRELYPNNAECLIILFNSRHLGADECLQLERDAWRGSATVEALTTDCMTLIVWPGGATRLAS